jgi:nucleotide-binding universal stress UspA family protein
MLRIDRILFPTDFSAAAEDAFSHATYLARIHGATMHVFNVVSPYDDDANNPMEHLPLKPIDGDGEGEAMHYAAGGELDLAFTSDDEGTVPVVYGQLRSVSPAKAIIDYAEAEAIDLVVMGTHGRRGLERLLSGGVAEEVVRQAPCPVLTVLAREEPGPGPHVGRLLAPVDLSEQSEAVVRYARALAEAYDASLDLLHVVEDTPYPAVYGMDPIAPMLPDVQRRAREALEELATRTLAPTDSDDGPAVEHQLHVSVGNAASEIVHLAEEGHADLIVMATHGRTGLSRFLIGSVAEKVVRTAPCLVFTLKSYGRSLMG